MRISRGDWITTAVTLVVAGTTYYVSGSKWAIGAITVGVIVFLVVHFFGSKEELETVPAGTTVRDSFNPSFSQSGVTVNVNTGHPQAPPVAPAVERVEVPASTPNVVCLGARSTFLRADGIEGLSFHQTDAQSGLPAIIVCFRNEAVFGRDVKPVRGARTYLKYYSTVRDEIGTGVSRALWVGSKSDLF